MSSSGPKTSCRIVFFGNEQIATGISTDAPILRGLITAGHTIVAIVLSDTGTKSRTKQTPAVLEIAKQHAIPVLTPVKPRGIIDELTSLQPDVGVLAAYGKIVPRAMIELFPHGILNIHPSLLPKHRGSMPIEAAILEDTEETGVSLMALAPEMDAGPIYAQATVQITGKDKQTITNELAELGALMVQELLPDICAGDTVAVPQDHSAATYDGRIDKSQQHIDLTKPAKQLAREVVAYAGWPGSKLTIANKDCTIINAHSMINREDYDDKKTIFVANKMLCAKTSDGILVIDSLKPAGKAAMPASAFIAGHKALL